jgi:hypothetical protein
MSWALNGLVSSLNIIVLRPSLVVGPVQGPGSGFWPSHQVGRVSFFFYFKSKQHRFSKKNKKKIKVNGFTTGSCWVNPPGHTGFFLPLFFLQPGQVPAPGWPSLESTRRVRPDFKTMLNMVGFTYLSIDYNFIIQKN